MERFFERCTEARGEMQKMKNPLVVGHYDADGLSATGVLVNAFRKWGKKPRFVNIRKVTPEELEKLRGERELVFCDLGSGYCNEIAMLDAKTVIIDHHQPQGDGVLQVNPHLFGMDGGREASGASTAYFACGMPELAYLGAVGAVGDLQLPFIGLNALMVKQGIEKGVIHEETGLSLFGSITRPLSPYLSFCTEPFLPGLSGNDSGCKKFLEELGIKLQENEKWRAYANLGQNEKKELVTALVVLLYQRGGIEATRNLVGSVYTFPEQPVGTELSEAHEFATMLNACGRHSQAETGVGVCTGEQGSFEKAKTLLAEHRKALREGVTYALEHSNDFGPFTFLDARGVIEDGIIGVVAGMVYSTITRNKPVLALSLDEKKEIKASGRATNSLVKKGVNLGKVMHEASAGYGFGGGHNIAAGASFKKQGVNEFLLKAGAILKQIDYS